MKGLTKIYYILTTLVILDLSLYVVDGITLATKTTDQILFWVWFILSFVVVFGRIKNRLARVYGLVLITLTAFSFFPIGLSIIAFMTPETQQTFLYKDSQIAVEKTVASVIGLPYVAIIKNYILFEKEIERLDWEFEHNGDYLSMEDVQSVVRLNEENKESIILSFNFEMIQVIKKINTD